MVTFDTVVGVLLGVVKRVREKSFNHGLECLGEISDDLVRFAVGVERTTEERLGRSNVASLRNEYVNHLAVFIDGSVDVAPLAGNLHVCLVDEPASANAASTRLSGVDE